MLAFQVAGVVTIVFVLVRLIPGNPAQALAGVGASQESIAQIEAELGLNLSLLEQYRLFWVKLFHFDLGKSIYTGQTVLEDLADRLPATLELITVSMVGAVVLGILLGIIVAMWPNKVFDRIVDLYGRATGSIPDFWLALVFVFLFFVTLKIAPAPVGRLSIGDAPPERITGFYTVDSLLTGDFALFGEAVAHLWLPVMTLILVYMGNILKMMRSSMKNALSSPYIEYATACGLPSSTITRYAIRNAMLPVATVVTFNYGFLLGGAVLVETVFSWGGLGQYAVQSVIQSDYAPVQGFVLVVGMFMAMLYLLLDIVYALLDPRIKH